MKYAFAKRETEKEKKLKKNLPKRFGGISSREMQSIGSPKYWRAVVKEEWERKREKMLEIGWVRLKSIQTKQPKNT